MRLYLSLIIFAIVFSACSLINEPQEACPVAKDEETITLSFQMTATGPMTRTDGLHDEQVSEILQLEDGIDYNDLGLFVFAQVPSKPDNPETLILKTTDILSDNNKDMYIIGSPGAYTVSMKILRTTFHDILFGADSDEEIDPNGKDMITFRILIVANCSASETMWNNITAITFADVIKELNKWDYDMNQLYNSTYEGKDVEGLYTNKKKNIPMFGTNYFQVTQSSLFYSRPEDRFFLGEIDLLRALAKVRVVDNIQNKDKDGFPKIIGAKFIGSKSTAIQLPWEADKYVNGNQVHTPNIYKPDEVVTLENTTQYRLGIINKDFTTIPSESRTGSVWGGFIPEQKIGYVNNNVGAPGMPGFKITVEFYPNVIREYEIPMTEYKGEKFEFGDNILRNHIYTLSVQDITYSEAAVTIDVVPYLGVTLNPWFGFD